MKLEMVRVQLVGLKTALLPTVETLRSLRCVQIEDAEQAAGLLLHK